MLPWQLSEEERWPQASDALRSFLRDTPQAFSLQDLPHGCLDCGLTGPKIQGTLEKVTRSFPSFLYAVKDLISTSQIVFRQTRDGVDPLSADSAAKRLEQAGKRLLKRSPTQGFS